MAAAWLVHMQEIQAMPKFMGHDPCVAELVPLIDPQVHMHTIEAIQAVG